ncbi:hypothetical protein QA596_10360 [Balneolales bacterium ANBcel1]|nr:hypothetical protein [Balneolales bacterium ANBcel1]
MCKKISYSNSGNYLQFIVSLISYLILLVLFLILSGGLFQSANGQQMVVDDADITDFRAFQLEAWLGSEESWILPAFSPVRNLEVGAGAVFSDDETYFVGELKYMFRAPGPNTPGFALVTGALMALFEEFYAFVPATLPVLDERLMLHANLGYALARYDVAHGDHTHSHEDHLFIWGGRADLNLHGPFWLLGEVFGANGDTPDFQGGLRIEVIPGLLEVDLTYGNSFSRHSSGMGVTGGIAWTPSPLR